MTPETERLIAIIRSTIAVGESSVASIEEQSKRLQEAKKAGPIPEDLQTECAAKAAFAVADFVGALSGSLELLERNQNGQHSKDDGQKPDGSFPSGPDGKQEVGAKDTRRR